MIRHTAVLEESLERALRQVAELRGEPCAARVRTIVRKNMERGRLGRFLEKEAGASACDYVWHVVESYDRWHEYVYQVQVEKGSGVWRPLLEKLRTWAYAYLGRWEVEPHMRKEWALGFADAAAGEMVKGYFPFDIEFDRWACVLLQNTCRTQMKQMGSGAAGFDEVAVEWAAAEGWLCDYLESDGRDLEREVCRQCDLAKAMERLSKKRQQVVQMHYYERRSFGEIGSAIGVKPETLHKRHYDALKQLERVLGSDYGRKS